MGSFTFKWDHPANEVYVTGTFDNWAKSVKLEKDGESFQKTVELNGEEEKILYKFVVDGNWTTDHTAPSERDSSGITNNVLLLKDIKPSPGSAHIMSSASPESTTAKLAGEQPKESRSQMLSSAAPDSSTAQLAGEQPKESSPSSLPGTFPETPAQEVEKTFGVSPIPATGGAGNPIQLKPGEKVPDPSTLTGNTVENTVKTDQASYEKSDAGVPQLGPVVTPEKEREARGGMFALPPSIRNLIPESSLPMGGSNASEPDPGVTVQSAAPQSTTAQLAGQVPLEPRGVPEIVKESQQKADVEPEAAGSPEAVQKKVEVESQLLNEVQEQPPVPEGGPVGGTPTVNPEVQKVIDSMNARSGTNVVPDVVTKSISKADESPEAAANPEAVKEKAAVENELLKEVKPVQDSGEPAPSQTAAYQGNAADSAPASSALSPNSMSDPEPLKSSTELAGQNGGAHNGVTSMSIPPTSDLNAPASVPAQSAGTGAEQTETKPLPTDETVPKTVTDEPSVTTGVVTGTTEPTSTPTAGPATPQKSTGASTAPRTNPVEEVKGTPDSTRTSESGVSADKKNKRRSFFGRLKDKLK